MRRNFAVFGGLLFAMTVCNCRPSENGTTDPSGAGAVNETTADASADANSPVDAGKSTAGSCLSNDTCPADQVCWQQACTQTCTENEDCKPPSPGTVTACYDHVCVIPCKATRDCPSDTTCRRVPGKVLKGGVVYPSVTACITALLGVDAESGQP